MSQRKEILYIRSKNQGLFIQKLEEITGIEGLSEHLGEKLIEESIIEQLQSPFEASLVTEFCFGGYPAFYIFAKVILNQLSFEEGSDYVWRKTTVFEDEREVDLNKPLEEAKVLVSKLNQDSTICMDDINQVFKDLVRKTNEKKRFAKAVRILFRFHKALQYAVPEAGYNKKMVTAILCSNNWKACRLFMQSHFEWAELPKSVEPHIFEDMQLIIRKVLEQRDY